MYLYPFIHQNNDDIKATKQDKSKMLDCRAGTAVVMLNLGIRARLVGLRPLILGEGRWGRACSERRVRQALGGRFILRQHGRLTHK